MRIMPRIQRPGTRGYVGVPANRAGGCIAVDQLTSPALRCGLRGPKTHAPASNLAPSDAHLPPLTSSSNITSARE
uniref:Uncharacterized protein n=1 Tax=Triticum urartu TaxID=4572 RepID=A0A8R7THB1_TRIUA